MSCLRCAVVTVAVILMALPTFEQGLRPEPKFEVASIKPAKLFTPADLAAGGVHLGIKINPQRVDIGFMNLSALIATAYKVRRDQISGPNWLASSMPFDIVATLPPGAAKDQIPDMIKALLVERFGLIAHSETKEQPVFALVVGKHGVRLNEVLAASTRIIEADPKFETSKGYDTGASRVANSGPSSSKIVTISGEGLGQIKLTPRNGGTHMEAPQLTINGLIKILSPALERPVLDLTGLTGTYNISMDFAGKGPGRSDPSDVSADALRAPLESLGLLLERRKAPVEVIVIDHLEKNPTAN